VTPAVLLGIVGVIGVGFLIRRVFKRRGRSIGAGAAGAYYDMLNKDQREAVAVIVEKRAEKQDPETRDGTLPEN
jgi:hypothetical protein